MTRKTIVALLLQADTNLPDNTSGDISAADVRDLLKDIIDTFKPGFGAIGNDLHTLVALGITPVVIPYTTLLAVTADFTANLVAGQITRNSLGLPSTNTRVTFATDMACQDGSEVVFSLYRDGINVPGGTTASGRGLGNITEATFEIINAQPVAGNPVYEVRASKITGAASNVDLTNVRLILEVVPTLGV
jgi:hypothetical protein